MNDRIRELQRQIEFERKQIENCKHEYGEARYNPETVREAYGYKLIAHGSDVYPEAEGYRDVQKPRWTRQCKKCGYEQHTHTKKPVITDYVPDFGS